MDDKKGQIGQDAETVKKGANLAKNVASGNAAGAIKNAKELLKDPKIRKKIRRKILKAIFPFIITIIISMCFFSILLSVTNKMMELLSSVTTKVGNLWNYVTDDYWIKLDEEIEYTNEDETTEKLTLIDKYVKELGNFGVSLKDLRLLGDADYTDEEKLLENPENKKLVEKYISEFVRADLITQQLHKRRGEELVSETYENWIDGGVYLYRTKNDTDISGSLEVDKGTYVKRIGNNEYVQMTYIEKEKFDELVKNDSKKLRYKYTVNKETGEILIAKIKTTKVIEGDISNGFGDWFLSAREWINEKIGLGGDVTTEVEDVISFDYKSYIEKYTMPYEFLINLCTITQNPEFVYHVALLARNTNIILAIQDDTTVVETTVEERNKYETYKNYGGSDTSGASKEEEEKKGYRKTTIVTTIEPHLQLEFADTWSFYTELEYSKTMDVRENKNGPNIETYGLPGTLSQYQPPTKYTETIDYSGATVEREHPGYWYDTFHVEKEYMTQTIITTAKYNEPIEKDNIEKSKQFLGLLRNDTGECPVNCFANSYSENWSLLARTCAEKAVFNRSGYNVKYKIPNMDRYEMPLNKLESGLGILYNVLGENIDIDNGNKAEYNEKMQGLLDHMKYLMTFPENEKYDLKDMSIIDIIGDIIGDDDEDEDEETEIENGEFLSIAKQCHDFLKNNNYFYSSDKNKNNGGPPIGWPIGAKDGISTGRNIPISTTTVESKENRYIDCSAYVSWILYIAGYRDAGWQWSSSTLLNNPMGFEEVSTSNMKPGDILVKNGHTEIYAGNGRSYSCGSTRSIRKDTVTTMNGIQKVFRVPN